MDGAEKNPPSFYTSRHYEVCKFYSLDEHTTVPDVLLISTSVWNTLDDQEKQWLEEAVQESVVYQRKVWKEASDEALAEVEKAGVEIIRPDKELFSARVQDMLEGYRDEPRVWELIQRIRAMEVSEN